MDLGLDLGRSSPDPQKRRFAFRGVAADQDDPRPHGAEALGRHEPDARGCTGHDAGLALERRHRSPLSLSQKPAPTISSDAGQALLRLTP